MSFYIELLLIVGLILLNGFFAAAEIAIISLRRSKTKELINKGEKRAEIIEYFQTHHQQFLATIQVGITFVSTIASAFGGAQLVEDIAPLFQQIKWAPVADNSEIIAFFVVVMLISYLSLILGELVPKSLALRFTQKIALFVSYPIKVCATVFSVFVRFLTFSSNLILRPFRKKQGYYEAQLSEEEIRTILEEGMDAGTIEKREHQFLENVFSFGDLEVGKIMIPHNKMDVLDIEMDDKEIIQKILKHNHTRIPVYEDQVDNIIGILYSKDLFEKIANKRKFNLRDIIRPALFVPSTQRLHDVLQKFKKEKMHMAIVMDEHGGVDGLVTLEDILEEIVGDIEDEIDKISKEIQEQPDGSFLVEGSTSITDFNRFLDTDLPEDAQYNSISGFILDRLHRFPKRNEKIHYENLVFQIKEKTKTRIKSIHVRKKKQKK